jgi:hypothetical protein
MGFPIRAGLRPRGQTLRRLGRAPSRGTVSRSRLGPSAAAP